MRCEIRKRNNGFLFVVASLFSAIITSRENYVPVSFVHGLSLADNILLPASSLTLSRTRNLSPSNSYLSFQSSIYCCCKPTNSHYAFQSLASIRIKSCGNRSSKLWASASGNNDDAKELNENYIDAVVEERTSGLALNDEENMPRRRKRDLVRKALRDLASLSLVDYKWRSALFKKNEADRMEEEMVARMMGEDASYARPMDADASRRGPLGNAEKSAVQWLQSVIEEEGRRARRIAESDGELIRPKDLSDTDEAGPLSSLERRAIQFLNEITDSEVERVRSGTMRPKDMVDRGPLGEAEARAVLALEKIVESEKLRMDQSRLRGGEAVRPIDVPGPLGEFERLVGDIIRAERQRVKDRESNEGKLVRPKDASIPSALGNVEKKAVEDWELLRKEENERLLSFRRFLNERRPMEKNKDSPLGVTEAFTVGLFRGPRLIAKVVDRVKELMKSEDLDDDDRELIRRSLPAPEDEMMNRQNNGTNPEMKDRDSGKGDARP